MPFELEALVGHLYVMGGRTLNTTPPGALVEVAPHKAARGRETDTFFVMVMPSGEIAASSFYQQMSLMAAERFFSTGGSVTSALRDVFNTLNNNLFEHNHSGRKHYEASMVCAVLRGNDLYLARTGGAISVLRHSGQTQTLPEALDDEDALYLPPLGVQPIPEVQMKRYPVDSGSRLLLVDATLAEITPERIDQSLVAQNVTHVLDAFRTLVTRHVRMMLVEFVPPADSVDLPVVEGESTTDINAEIAAARSKAQQAKMVAAARKEAAERRRARRSRTEKLQEQAQKRAGKAVYSAGRSLSALGELSGKLFARRVPTSDAERTRPQLSARFITFAVFLLPFTIVLVVVLSWLTNMGTTRFEQCIQETLGAADLARSMDSSSPRGVLAAWESALLIADSCEEMRPDDPTILAIRREGQDVIDRLNNISRRESILLATFEGAVIDRLILRGLDLYALDSVNSLVYRVQIGASGTEVASLPQPIPNMRRGTTVDGLPVGNIIDIAFDDDEQAVVALDRQGVLVRCLPRFIMECDAQRLLATENWVTPIAINIWQRRLYVLDAGAEQLWRYEPSGTTYASVPTEYFTGAARPNLVRAVDFSINSDGFVYVLYSDGVMSAYYGGEPQPFAFADFPEDGNLTEIGAQSMYLNDSPINPAFYIVNQPGRTIYETTRAGTFMARYRVFDEDTLTQLQNVVVEPGQGIIYAASGNSIFAIRMDD